MVPSQNFLYGAFGVLERGRRSHWGIDEQYSQIMGTFCHPRTSATLSEKKSSPWLYSVTSLISSISL
jgi:hypothetical protein